jgi:GTP diphosphokinase / guanosine-3',5'-bis(diphosphate) 3'-diphosphatase
MIHSQEITTAQNIPYENSAKQLWQDLLPHIAYLSKSDSEVVELAFLQMVEAHKGFMRKSGEYYIVHPVAATTTLADIGLDVDTLAACLLHDVPEDTHVTLEDLQKHFNADVVFLVFGITKLGKIKYQGIDRYAENLRKMFIAMSKDIRVVFIKLADRLHNLQTLASLPPEKAHRIALESLEIYAPIAERLGINYLKEAIEDAAFPFAYPAEYTQLHELSDIEISMRTKQVELLKTELSTALEHMVNNGDIQPVLLKGRAKKYYSLFKKFTNKSYDLENVYDLVALRVVCKDIDDCYKVLSTVHTLFEPMQGRLKDYILQPKPNGYQSLHTSVRDSKSGVIFEVQIRTKEMHEFAEYGVASHWSYKAAGGNHSTGKVQKASQFLDTSSLKWVRELIELGKEEISHEEYLRHVKLDVFQDRIFVMTPKGDVIDLPSGATALDFAYRIHEQIGAHAVMAKANETTIKLSDELKNGDTVTILTDKKQNPKIDWLQWVRTGQAAKHIRMRLRKIGVNG